MPVRVCCLSDLHGYLPPRDEIPEADILLLAGDYCPMRDIDKQALWMEVIFAPWVNDLCERMPVVAVAGNHDFIFEREPARVPAMRWTYLQDSGTTLDGLNIYGTPWQPRFFDWAFNADEPDLRAIWARIPDDTDILLLHGPPHGYGDFTSYGNVHCGSPSLTARIREVQPRLVVAGHIHDGYGQYAIGETNFVNAAHVDEQYRPINSPVLVELP